MERKIDELGRVVIPMEIRKALGWPKGANLEIAVKGGEVILKKSESRCTFCGDIFELKDVKGVRVCQSCIDEIKASVFWEEA